MSQCDRGRFHGTAAHSRCIAARSNRKRASAQSGTGSKRRSTGRRRGRLTEHEAKIYSLRTVGIPGSNGCQLQSHSGHCSSKTQQVGPKHKHGPTLSALKGGLDCLSPRPSYSVHGRWSGGPSASSSVGRRSYPRSLSILPRVEFYVCESLGICGVCLTPHAPAFFVCPGHRRGYLRVNISGEYR
jgi:hypothetical protein